MGADWWPSFLGPATSEQTALADSGSRSSPERPQVATREERFTQWGRPGGATSRGQSQLHAMRMHMLRGAVIEEIEYNIISIRQEGLYSQAHRRQAPTPKAEIAGSVSGQGGGRPRRSLDCPFQVLAVRLRTFASRARIPRRNQWRFCGSCFYT